MVTVCTVLPPPERPRLDAAGDGCFTTLHTSSFRDALRAVRRKRVDALVLSVHTCRGDELPAVARFVREFPPSPPSPWCRGTTAPPPRHCSSSARPASARRGIAPTPPACAGRGT